MKTNELFSKILEILPNAIFDEDEAGEIIIATGFEASEYGDLVEVAKDQLRHESSRVSALLDKCQWYMLYLLCKEKMTKGEK